MSLQLYHNPRCSKSRAAFALLTDKAIDFETILYLENPPSTQELAKIISLLGFSSARELMRTSEKVYKELELATVDDEQQLLAAMVAHPKLIERPILLGKDKAAIARPLENLYPLL